MLINRFALGAPMHLLEIIVYKWTYLFSTQGHYVLPHQMLKHSEMRDLGQSQMALFAF